MLTCDDYRMPTTLKQALQEWAALPDGSRIVAGATDLLPWAREGRAGDVHLPAILDVTRIAELQGYEVRGDRVRLGASVVFQRFLNDETLQHHLPCMPYCAVWFADDQIREQATLAGNIVNASPAADGTPPMIALNATVELARLDGDEVATRQVPIAEFVTGPAETGLQPHEIITAIECDSMAGYGGSFEKVGQRRSLVISVVCAVGLVKPSQDGKTFQDVRLALGGIGPVPVRLPKAEQFLIGQPISADVIRRASALGEDLINSRTRREYRREVVRGFIARALEEALNDYGAAVPPVDLEEVIDA